MKTNVFNFQKWSSLNESDEVGDTAERDLAVPAWLPGQGESDKIVSLFYYNTKNGDVAFFVDDANINQLDGVYNSVASDPDLICWVIDREDTNSDGEFRVYHTNGEINVEGGKVITKIDMNALRKRYNVPGWIPGQDEK